MRNWDKAARHGPFAEKAPSQKSGAPQVFAAYKRRRCGGPTSSAGSGRRPLPAEPCQGWASLFLKKRKDAGGGQRVVPRVFLPRGPFARAALFSRDPADAGSRLFQPLSPGLADLSAAWPPVRRFSPAIRPLLGPVFSRCFSQALPPSPRPPAHWPSAEPHLFQPLSPVLHAPLSPTCPPSSTSFGAAPLRPRHPYRRAPRLFQARAQA